MARPTYIRLSAVEFSMTCVFAPYAPPMIDALRSVLVDGSTVAEAALTHGLNPNSVQSAKNRFWLRFVKLSRSYQAVYGVLDSQFLYRFTENTLPFLPYKSADVVQSLGADAARNQLSEMAFNQIALLTQIRSKKALAAVKDNLCYGITLDEAGQRQGLTRQAVGQSCRAFVVDVWLMDEAQIVLEKNFKLSKIGVLALPMNVLLNAP